jgi:hypothetical protein
MVPFAIFPDKEGVFLGIFSGFLALGWKPGLDPQKWGF